MADPYAAFSTRDDDADPYASFSTRVDEPPKSAGLTTADGRPAASALAAQGFSRGGRAPDAATRNAMMDNGLTRFIEGVADDPAAVAQAGAAGVNRGVVDLAGLPVDTIQNVLDLGKIPAGMLARRVSRKEGTVPLKAGGQPLFFDVDENGKLIPGRVGASAGDIPDALLPPDRSQVVGSGDYLANKLDAGTQALGGGPVTQNLAPDNPAARVVYGTARAVPGAATGRQVLASGAGGGTATVVAEAGGDPAMQAVAGALGNKAGTRTAPKLEGLPSRAPVEVLDPPLTFNGPDAQLAATGKPRGNAFTQLEGDAAPPKPQKPAVVDDPDAEPQGSPAREEVRKGHVQLLQDEGIPLDAAQRSGSKKKEAVKRQLNDNPVTIGAQQRFAEKQGAAFTNAVLKKIGINEEAATPEVMGRKLQRLGNTFDEIAERNPVKYDGKLNADLAQISKDATRELTSPDAAVIGRQIEEIFTKAETNGGAIDGKTYQNLRSSLGRISEQRTPLGHWAGELREVLDDALQRSSKKQDLMDLRVARTQYRRMMQIEGSIDEFGQISPSKLANSLNVKSNRRATIYGRGDTELARLAKAGKAVLPDKFPNSGTTARFMQQLPQMTLTGALTTLATAIPLKATQAMMNRQPKAKKPAEQPNRLSALGGG